MGAKRVTIIGSINGCAWAWYSLKGVHFDCASGKSKKIDASRGVDSGCLAIFNLDPEFVIFSGLVLNE